MAAHKLVRSLKSTTTALKAWNRSHFGYANKKIQNLEEELRIIQLQDGDSTEKERYILEELRIQRQRWESILKQKSCEIWIKEGDRNTKFFHMSLLLRRRRNRVEAIKDEAQWIIEADDIKNYFMECFEKLFKYDYPFVPDGLEGISQSLVTTEENETLLQIPDEEEIKATV